MRHNEMFTAESCEPRESRVDSAGIDFSPIIHWYSSAGHGDWYTENRHSMSKLLAKQKLQHINPGSGGKEWVEVETSKMNFPTPNVCANIERYQSRDERFVRATTHIK